MWRRFVRKLRALAFSGQLEREMERELRFHLERETEENLRRGMKPEAARRAAVISFGGVERFKEECRDVRRPRRLETLWQDARFGARMLRRNPGSTFIAVLTLALGPTRSSEAFIANRNRRMMSAFGRLKPEARLAQSQSEIGMIAGRLHQEHPESYPANRGYRTSIASLHAELTQHAKPVFLLLLGTAGLVLLIACANVANLALARVMRRERELAVRTALGASRGRLARLLLTESLLLSLAGGALGIVLAVLSTDLLVRYAERFSPRAHEIGVDGAALGFALAVSLLTGLAFGLLPALSVGRNLIPSLKEGTQSAAGPLRQRMRGALVVAQVAVSFMLLIAAGLTARSLFKLQQVNPGFDPERVLVMNVQPNWTKYNTQERYRDFGVRLLEQAKPQPGVLTAALATTYPFNPMGIAHGPFNRDCLIEGQTPAAHELAPQADGRAVTFDYFQTIRQPLISGRYFSEQDHERAQPVAIINQSFARRRFGKVEPLGKRISFNRGETWLTVVGVVADVKHYGLQRETLDEAYRPLAQLGSGANYLLLRTKVAPESLTRQLRAMVYGLDAETAIEHVRTLEEARNETLASPRLTATLLGLFALLALLITAAGIAGVMALNVAQRTHEIGVRLALGASKGAVLRLVLRQGMTLVSIGLGIGAIVALALTRSLSALLYAVEPTDPLTFLAVAAALALTAATACLIPARRVLGIDPMIALRSE
jgi:predicted permease